MLVLLDVLFILFVTSKNYLKERVSFTGDLVSPPNTLGITTTTTITWYDHLCARTNAFRVNITTTVGNTTTLGNTITTLGDTINILILIITLTVTLTLTLILIITLTHIINLRSPWAALVVTAALAVTMALVTISGVGPSISRAAKCGSQSLPAIVE
jgi:hypothetical protein